MGVSKKQYVVAAVAWGVLLHLDGRPRSADAQDLSETTADVASANYRTVKVSSKGKLSRFGKDDIAYVEDQVPGTHILMQGTSGNKLLPVLPGEYVGYFAVPHELVEAFKKLFPSDYQIEETGTDVRLQGLVKYYEGVRGGEVTIPLSALTMGKDFPALPETPEELVVKYGDEGLREVAKESSVLRASLHALRGSADKNSACMGIEHGLSFFQKRNMFRARLAPKGYKAKK